MSELPHFFEYLKEHPQEDHPLLGKFDLYPFAYDDEAECFTVGPTRIHPHEFDPYTFNPYVLGIKDRGIELDDLPEHPAVLPGFGAVILGPRAHEYAMTNVDGHNVIKVMHDVFTSFLADPSDFPLRENVGHLGFAAWQREDGGFGLQVVGDCACSNPNLQGLHVQGMENGWAEYDLHNADSVAQRTSLYAGLGHIAHLAGKELSN
jgi:hypothetical protein